MLILIMIIIVIIKILIMIIVMILIIIMIIIITSGNNHDGDDDDDDDDNDDDDDDDNNNNDNNDNNNDNNSNNNNNDNNDDDDYGQDMHKKTNVPWKTCRSHVLLYCLGNPSLHVLLLIISVAIAPVSYSCCGHPQYMCCQTTQNPGRQKERISELPEEGHCTKG